MKNYTMKRIILILACLLMSMVLCAQQDTIKVNEPVYDKCLFSYNTKYIEEFEAVIDYMESFGIKVISTCEDECLIFVELTEKYKDPTVLFKRIERAYSGKCLYKSSADVIMQYDKCRDVYVKELIKQQE